MFWDYSVLDNGRIKRRILEEDQINAILGLGNTDFILKRLTLRFLNVI